MQINYHLVLTKIQKLQNWKKKKTLISIPFCTDQNTQNHSIWLIHGRYLNRYEMLMFPY